MGVNPLQRVTHQAFLRGLVFVVFALCGLAWANPPLSPLYPLLVVEGRDFGLVQLSLPEDQNDLVLPLQALGPLQQALSPLTYQRIATDPGQPNISLKDLRERGCTVQYDPLRFVLDVRLPPQEAQEFQQNTTLPPREASEIPPTADELRQVRGLFAARQENTPLGKALSRILEFANSDQRNQATESDQTANTPSLPSNPQVKKVPTPLASAASSELDTATALQSVPVSKSNPKTTPSNPKSKAIAPAPVNTSTGNNNGPNLEKEMLEEMRGMRSLLAQMALQGKGIVSVDTNPGPAVPPKNLSEIRADASAQEKMRADSLVLAEQERKIIEEQFGGDSKEELYAKIFGITRPARAHKIMVDIFVEAQKIGQGQVTYNEAFSNFTVESQQLTRYLNSFLLPNSYAKLNLGSTFSIPDVAFAAAGMKIKLQEDLFELHIAVPVALRKEQRYDLAWRERSDTTTPIAPALLSAFLNINSSEYWMYQEVFFDQDSLKRLYLDYYDGERIQRLPFQADLNGAVNFASWVVEGRGRYLELQPAARSWRNSMTQSFRREEFTLVHDFGPQRVRLRAGDITGGGSVGAGSGLPLLGFRLDKTQGNSSLNHTNGLSSNGSGSTRWMQFQLLRPGNADVRVNGRSVSRLRLEAGPNAIGGFTGVVGQNNVEVVVTYDNGETEVIPYQFLEERQGSLAFGERSYSVSGGVLRKGDDHGMTYSPQIDSATAGFSVEQGLRHGWTAGLGADASPERTVGAIQLHTPYNHRGTLAFTGASSFGFLSSQFGFRAGVNASKPMLAGFVFSAGVEYISPNFSSVLLGLPITPTQLVKVSANLGLSAPIWKGNASLGLDTRFNRDTSAVSSALAPYAPVDYSFRASYGLTPVRGLSINVSSQVLVMRKEYTPQFNVFATYFFSVDRNSFQVSNQLVNRKQYQPPQLSTKQVRSQFDSTLTSDSLAFTPGFYERQWSNNSDARWSYSHGLGLNDGFAAGAGGNYQTNHVGASTNANYTHNNFQAMANYSMADYSRTLQLSRTHNLSARVETSLLFADGLWTFGRPVQNGFVLVKGQNELANTSIRINPEESYSSEIGKSGNFTAGAYPDLGEYQTTTLRFVPENPPLGSWSGREDYLVQGEYKRGFALRIGAMPTVLLQATIVDESGEPVKRNTFTVFDKASPNEVLMESFTTARGILQAGNLTPGHTYIVRFPKDSFIDDLTIEVPKSARGVVQMGKIVVKHQRMSQNIVK